VAEHAKWNPRDMCVADEKGGGFAWFGNLVSKKTKKAKTKKKKLVKSTRGNYY